MDEKKFLPLLVILVVGAAFFYVCYLLINVLTPFLLSLAIAYVINPGISNLEARGIRRSPIVITLYLALAIVLTLMVTRLAPFLSAEWSSLQQAAPTYLSSTEKFLETVPQRVSRSLPIGADVVEDWIQGLYGPLVRQLEHLPTYIMGLFPILSLFILVPFITFFLLVDANTTVTAMIQACPSRHVEQALYLISEIDTSLGNYLRGIIIESIVVALMAYCGLFMLGIDYALAISTLAGVSCFVPYLGALIGAGVGGAVAVIQFGSVVSGLEVVALFAGIRFVDDWLLQPMIIKHSVNLHPLIYVMALMVGAQLLGFLGLVLAMPVACVIKSLIKVSWDWYSTQATSELYAHLDTGSTPYT